MLEMSSSWNFPARASLSYKGSEPSRVELEHINFRADNSNNMYVKKLQFCASIIIIICFMFNFMNLYKRIGIFGVKHYNLGT